MLVSMKREEQDWHVRFHEKRDTLLTCYNIIPVLKLVMFEITTFLKKSS